jgi:hypothetical protein
MSAFYAQLSEDRLEYIWFYPLKISSVRARTVGLSTNIPPEALAFVVKKGDFTPALHNTRYGVFRYR